MFCGLGEQLISGAYVFGVSAIVFATVSFVVVVVLYQRDSSENKSAKQCLFLLVLALDINC